MSSRNLGNTVLNYEAVETFMERSRPPTSLAINEALDHEDMAQPTHRKILTISDFHELTKEGSAALENVKVALKGSEKENVTTWSVDIDQLQDQSSELRRPIIAIVGVTGAGKSSLLNALLGSVRLLPTHCARACTATPIEISLNTRADGPLHRAEIEFISAEDWQNELSSLLRDIIEPDGSISKEISEKDSEAQVAFCKLKAVYPSQCDNVKSQSDIEPLMEMAQVRTILGTKLTLGADSPDQLQTLIRKYVDSKDKALAKSKQRGPGAPASNDMEYWPLIRKVSIQTKAPILESGCVLVDLPGTGDSNKARSSVAASYLQHCTALWIVSPINRAVDDGHARTLMGEAFKRQIFRDGSLDRTTFICSKSHEIDAEGARADFAHYPEFAATITSIEEKKQETYGEILELKRIVKDFRVRQNDLKTDLRRVEALEREYRKIEEEVLQGVTKYPLALVDSNKRAHQAESPEDTSDKRLKTSTHHMATRSGTSTGSTDSTAANSSKTMLTSTTKYIIQEDFTQPALTRVNCDEKRKELKEERLQLQTELLQLNNDVVEYEKEINGHEIVMRKYKRAEWLACVKQRNSYAVEALKNDFAAGIRDINRAEAEKDDREFDPSTQRAEETNTDGCDLPVYCVSTSGYRTSLPYQNKRSRRKHGIQFFEDIEDTGIPLLVAHVRRLGSRHLQQNANEYINEVNRVLSSLRIWSGSTDSQPSADSRLTEQESIEMYNIMAAFFDVFQNILEGVMNFISNDLITQVTNELPLAAENAIDRVRDIYEKWGNSLRWNTYRAVAYRQGRYVKKERDIDFHSELLLPFRQQSDPVWDLVLNRKIPRTMDNCVRAMIAQTEEFKKNFGAKLTSSAAAGRTVHAFQKHANLFMGSIYAAVRGYKVGLQAGQQEANRLPHSYLSDEMSPVYPIMASQYGKGCFARMKEDMHKHVSKQKAEMFTSAEERTSDKLKNEEQRVRSILMEEMRDLCQEFRNACMTLTARRPAEAFMSLDAHTQAALLKALDDIAMPFGMVMNTSDAEVPNDILPETELEVNDSNDWELSTDEFENMETLELSDDSDDD